MGKKIKGTLERPRLYIFRSNKHIYAQVIDDINAKILVTISSISPEIKTYIKSSATCEASKIVGRSIAEKCISKGIKKIVFDRGGKLYHGRVKALGQSVREAGINF
jgi:large subunit ribosomal protein L18